MNKPFLVGITGGIGAGKSIVSNIFKSLGVPVYDADYRAKWLMTNSENLKPSIEMLFGEESYQDGKLNRKHVAALAFYKPALLSKLNVLVHPKVEQDFNEWVNENFSHPYVMKEAALLFETTSYTRLDKVILVLAPKDVRLKRVFSRDTHRSKDEIKAIMDKQLPDKEKKEKADIILSNNETTLLIPQLLKLHEQFLALSR